MNNCQEQTSPPTKQLRVGLLYSFAPHFKKAAMALRAAYPEAQITALIPPDLPLDVVAGVVDEQQVCAPAPGVHRSPGEALRVARAVRKAQFDMFVVLFDSPRLQAIAAISGAPSRYWFGLDGALHPLQIRIATACSGLLWRRIRGTLLYWRIWLHIRRTRIEPIPKDDKSAGTQGQG